MRQHCMMSEKFPYRTPSLNKKGRLTDEEMEIMKTHTTKGYEIIKGFKLNDDEEQERYSLDIAKYHHERWDGKRLSGGLTRAMRYRFGVRLLALWMSMMHLVSPACIQKSIFP